MAASTGKPSIALVVQQQHISVETLYGVRCGTKLIRHSVIQYAIVFFISEFESMFSNAFGNSIRN